ncbi:MAG: tRNA pseudouridine synthase [Frankiales bacterium]|nr:tRNA pseudouridine synthase [Frankiales bacterium]
MKPAPENPAPAPDGLVVIDKPAGWTSHDVVGRTRRLARTRKVGHAGTLDPMATGVLLLGIGRATRLLGHLALTDKTYLATIRLGATTVTDDAEGDVLVTTDASAVTVSRFALLERRGDDLYVEVDCSTGTYVRALARDLGRALEVGAHLTALRRTRVGSFGLDVARDLEQLEEGFDAAVLSLDEAVARSFPRRDLSEQEAVDLSYGKKLQPTGRGGTVAAFAPDGGCVALIVDRHDVAKAAVVFRPASG